MTSTSLSFVTNNIPFFLTIRRNYQPQGDSHTIESHKVIFQEKYKIKYLRNDFKNCSTITDNICNLVGNEQHLSKRSLNRLEFIVNELIENLYKYSTENIDKYVTLTIYAVNSENNNTTYVISTSNYADSENVRGIVKSFKLIKKEFSADSSYSYDKSFLGTRGHMGWITITKFNTMTHILATRVDKNTYSIETNVLLTDK